MKSAGGPGAEFGRGALGARLAGGARGSGRAREQLHQVDDDAAHLPLALPQGLRRSRGPGVAARRRHRGRRRQGPRALEVRASRPQGQKKWGPCLSLSLSRTRSLLSLSLSRARARAPSLYVSFFLSRSRQEGRPQTAAPRCERRATLNARWRFFQDSFRVGFFIREWSRESLEQRLEGLWERSIESWTWKADVETETRWDHSLERWVLFERLETKAERTRMKRRRHLLALRGRVARRREPPGVPNRVPFESFRSVSSDDMLFRKRQDTFLSKESLSSNSGERWVPTQSEPRGALMLSSKFNAINPLQIETLVGDGGARLSRQSPRPARARGLRGGLPQRGGFWNPSF